MSVKNQVLRSLLTVTGLAVATGTVYTGSADAASTPSAAGTLGTDVVRSSSAMVASATLAYPTKATVHGRSGPGLSYKVVKTYPAGTYVRLVCQTPGDSIYGDNLWDKTTDHAYVADYYVRTGTSGYVTGRCGSSQ